MLEGVHCQAFEEHLRPKRAVLFASHRNGSQRHVPTPQTFCCSLPEYIVSPSQGFSEQNWIAQCLSTVRDRTSSNSWPSGKQAVGTSRAANCDLSYIILLLSFTSPSACSNALYRCSASVRSHFFVLPVLCCALSCLELHAATLRLHALKPCSCASSSSRSCSM